MTRPILALSNHATFVGGGEHSFLDLVSHLPGTYPVIAAYPSEGSLAEKTCAMGIPTRIVPLPPIGPTHLVGMIDSLHTLKNICKSKQIRLIYANGSRAAFYGGTVGRLCAIPTVWHCRVSTPDPYLDPVLSRLVHRIIANSQATASRFPSSLQGKIEVVYNGFDLEWLRDPRISKPAWIEEHWIVILMVARTSRWKRHDLMLSAFERIAPHEPRAHLVCVGGGDPCDPLWWDELQRMTGASSFSSRIHWVGAVEDIRPWYRTAALMVLPSDNEPFGRVIVEALASGVPVVATRSGGIPEIVTAMESGFLISENDADAISTAVLDIISQPALRGQLIAEGLKRAECFGMPSHIQNMANLFQDVMDHGRKR